MRKAAIYIRVSTTEQEIGLQENELREFAERRGWEYEIFKTLAAKIGAFPLPAFLVRR